MYILEDDKCYYDLNQCRYFLWRCSENLKECRRRQNEIITDLLTINKNIPEGIKLANYRNKIKQYGNTKTSEKQLYEIEFDFYNALYQLKPKELKTYYLLMDQEEQLLDHEKVLNIQEKLLSAKEKIFYNNVELDD